MPFPDMSWDWNALPTCLPFIKGVIDYAISMVTWRGGNSDIRDPLL